MLFLSYVSLTFYGNVAWHMSSFGRLAMYQPQDTQYYHACIDTQDPWFHTSYHDRLEVCRTYYTEKLDTNSDDIKGYIINAESEIIQFFGMESICLFFDKDTGYMFFSWDAEAPVDCELFYLKGKKLTINLRLFLPAGLMNKPQIKPIQEHSDIKISEKLVCDELRDIFHSSVPSMNRPFTLLTGETTEKDRMKLWMSRCNLDPTFISVWKKAKQREKNIAVVPNDCSVHRVRSISSLPGKRKATFESQYLCIEDVLNAIASEDQSIRTVTYVSSVHIPSFPLFSSDSSRNNQKNLQSVDDIYRVIRALQHAHGVANLFITGFTDYDRTGSSYQNDVNQLLSSKVEAFSTTLKAVLKNALMAGPNSVFIEALDNFVSATDLFLKDYSGSLLNHQLLNLRCNYKEPSCRSLLRDQYKYIVWDTLLKVLEDIKLFVGLEKDNSVGLGMNCATQSCYLRQGSICETLNICEDMTYFRRILLAHSLLRIILPSKENVLNRPDIVQMQYTEIKSINVTVPSVTWLSKQELSEIYCGEAYMTSAICDSLLDINRSLIPNTDSSVSVGMEPDVQFSTRSPALVQLLRLAAIIASHRHTEIPSFAEPASSFRLSILTWAKNFDQNIIKSSNSVPGYVPEPGMLDVSLLY